MTVTQTRMSLEEFLKLPEEEPALELIDGVVVQKVSPAEEHSWLQRELVLRFEAHGSPRHILCALPELRRRLGSDSLVPDVAVYLWDRRPRTARGRIGPSPVLPDIAIEILSPDQSLRDQTDKCWRYIRQGVPVALLVNPRDETVRRFTSGDEVVLRGDDQIDISPVVPDLAVTVRELFASLEIDADGEEPEVEG